MGRYGALQQDPAGLLEHRADQGERVVLIAESEQAELGGQPLPHLRVVGADRCVLVEEAADGSAQVIELAHEKESRGSFQSRSAITLRWISLLPP